MKKDYKVLPSLKGIRHLFVGPYPPPYGGIASLFKPLMPALIKAGADDIAIVSFGQENSVERVDDATLYRFNIKASAWKVFSPQNIPLVLTVIKRLSGHGFSTYFLLRETIKAILIHSVARKHRSELVSAYMSHVNLQLIPLNDYWKRSKKIILTVLGEIYEPSKEQFMYQHSDLIKSLLGLSQKVLSSSRHCANSFKKLGIDTQIDVVFVGVETEDVTSQAMRDDFRKTNGIQESDVLVFFMGRMLKDMGLDVVLETAEDLLSKEPAARLLIAGATGDLSPSAQALAKQYPQKILTLENVPFEKKRELYSAADILVAPSFDQRACMGVSIKEAMAARLPVVAGAGGGIPEAVVDNETGFLVPVGPTGSVDDDKYLDAVCRLVRDSELRARLGHAGRQRAVDIFSVDATNHRIAEIFLAAVRSSN